MDPPASRLQFRASRLAATPPPLQGRLRPAHPPLALPHRRTLQARAAKVRRAARADLAKGPERRTGVNAGRAEGAGLRAAPLQASPASLQTAVRRGPRRHHRRDRQIPLHSVRDPVQDPVGLSVSSRFPVPRRTAPRSMSELSRQRMRNRGAVAAGLADAARRGKVRSPTRPVPLTRTMGPRRPHRRMFLPLVAFSSNRPIRVAIARRGSRTRRRLEGAARRQPRMARRGRWAVKLATASAPPTNPEPRQTQRKARPRRVATGRLRPRTVRRRPRVKIPKRDAMDQMRSTFPTSRSMRATRTSPHLKEPGDREPARSTQSPACGSRSKDQARPTSVPEATSARY